MKRPRLILFVREGSIAIQPVGGVFLACVPWLRPTPDAWLSLRGIHAANMIPNKNNALTPPYPPLIVDARRLPALPRKF